MNVIRNLAAWIVRWLLWLRYDITVVGKEKLSQREGVLILPNHPGETDPVIIFSHLWKPLQPRGMAVEDFYYMPVLHYLMRMIGVIPMPNMHGGIGSYKKYRVHKALKGAADCLNEGSNVIIYPAGRLMRSTREEVRASSAVYDVLSQVQQKKILLVRTRGLMGSSFSWVAWQETPPLFRCLLMSLKDLLMNLVFFSPRRKVVIELVESPADFPYHGTKMEMNRYLDNWYNKGGEEQIVLVPKTIWSNKSFAHRPSTLSREARVAIPPEVRQKVVNELARRRDMNVSEIQDAWSLSSQIGFDSLELAGMIGWLEEEFHAYEVKAEELRTVYDLQVAAAGAATAYSLTGDKPAPQAWHEPARAVAVLEPSYNTTVHMNFLRVCDRGGNAVAFADDTSGVVSYKRAKIGVLVLAEIIRQYPERHIGIMLPATGGAALVILATLLAGKVPIMVNWTLGDANIEHVLQLAGVKTILTSDRFLDRLDSIDFDRISEYVVTLESLRKRRITLWSKIRAALRSRNKADRIGRIFGSDTKSPDEPAVILFTSGSEAAPKGVPLSHKNILHNIAGCLDVVQPENSDSLYGFLPPFHSFGFTITTLLPLTSGLKVAFYPNPTDARTLARGIAMWKPTVICGTPTFISGIFRAASDDQLQSLRLIMTAGEKTPAELIETAANRFGARLLEGYGITECSPVLTLCRLDRQAVGVGPAIRDVGLRLVHPETYADVVRGQQGLILACGPNVFSGYLDRTSDDAFVELDNQRYYVTGDLGILDESDSLVITGRLKRFVKMGGEMISLPAMETVIRDNLPQNEGEITSALTYIEDPGQRPLICLFIAGGLRTEADTVNGFLRNAGLSNLTRVRKVMHIEEIPLLGTGKTNYRELTDLLRSSCNSG